MITKKYQVIFGGLALSGLLLVYYRFDPSEHGFFPPCLFHYFTGLDCPGCGSQRALHALLRFRFSDAFMFNPLLFISLPLLTYELFVPVFSKYNINLKRIFISKYSAYLSALIVMAFWILRNLPFYPFHVH